MMLFLTAALGDVFRHPFDCAQGKLYGMRVRNFDFTRR